MCWEDTNSWAQQGKMDVRGGIQSTVCWPLNWEHEEDLVCTRSALGLCPVHHRDQMGQEVPRYVRQGPGASGFWQPSKLPESLWDTSKRAEFSSFGLLSISLGCRNVRGYPFYLGSPLFSWDLRGEGSCFSPTQWLHFPPFSVHSPIVTVRLACGLRRRHLPSSAHVSHLKMATFWQVPWKQMCMRHCKASTVSDFYYQQMCTTPVPDLQHWGPRGQQLPWCTSIF